MSDINATRLPIPFHIPAPSVGDDIEVVLGRGENLC
uniref:Cyclopeptide IPFHIPAP n=1 Tax=Amanita pallidorosea TaxID=1324310 RepID=A0A6G9EL13_AMAPL|nr:cyclopeptide IPFHIPAP [Amanita pallidorosea]